MKPADIAKLSVNVPTPFQFTGIFESKFAPRGSVYLRHYKLERNGFEGPIEISLADRQIRHLQGVTGPTIVVPPGEAEFDYPVMLPPRLEVGRTSRTCLMATGDVQLENGETVRVAYASSAQNDQIIVLTAPEILSVKSNRDSYAVQPGGSVEVRLELKRGEQLNSEAKLELVCPAHVQGVKAAPVTLAADESSVTMKLEFEKAPLGPFNMPVTIRGDNTRRIRKCRHRRMRDRTGGGRGWLRVEG